MDDDAPSYSCPCGEQHVRNILWSVVKPTPATLMRKDISVSRASIQRIFRQHETARHYFATVSSSARHDNEIASVPRELQVRIKVRE